jgi:uncharacterized membrane protein
VQETGTARADDGPAATAKSRPADDPATAALIDQGGHVVARAVTINKPRAELYAFFRDFANLPTFMENVERIDVVDARRSHWVVKAPAGRTVEWDALVTDEREGELIAWTSDDGADVANSGTVTFQDAQAGRGTVVTAVIAYDPPGGAIGKLFQREPAIQARRDLRRFKQLMETGEVATASRNHREYEERG